MRPVDGAAARSFVFVILPLVVVKVAGGHFREEFFQNVVIPLDRRPILPRLERGAVVAESAVALHQVGMAGVVADAEVRGTEVMDRVEQFLRRVVGEPDVFDGDGDAELLRDRQQNLQRSEKSVVELLKGVAPPLLDGIAGVDGDAVDAEFRRDAESELQPVEHGAAQAGIGYIEVLIGSERRMRVDEGQAGLSNLLFELIFQARILHALADEHIGEHQVAGAVGGELRHDVGTHFFRAELEIKQVSNRNRIHDEILFVQG